MVSPTKYQGSRQAREGWLWFTWNQDKSFQEEYIQAWLGLIKYKNKKYVHGVQKNVHLGFFSK